MAVTSKRIALVASAVGLWGDGRAGGGSDSLLNSAKALALLGHTVTILAPQDSKIPGNIKMIPVAGALQPSIQFDRKDRYPILADNLLGNYFSLLHETQSAYDVIINFCNDWLPYYLTPFFSTPLVHRPNVGDEHPVVTAQIRETAARYPSRIGVLSEAQRHALQLPPTVALIRSCIDLSLYTASDVPMTRRDYLLFAARIAPEKGLEDAAEIARRCRMQLHVCGLIQDNAYFDSVQARYPGIVYRGFLAKPELVREMQGAKALLCTHHWVEALSVVVMEALACGTPVIAHDLGGPKECIAHGATGFVVPQGDVGQACDAVRRLDGLLPEDCRRSCEKQFSLAAFATRMEAWIKAV